MDKVYRASWRICPRRFPEKLIVYNVGIDNSRVSKIRSCNQDVMGENTEFSNPDRSCMSNSANIF
jgi:hypothetical protein